MSFKFFRRAAMAVCAAAVTASIAGCTVETKRPTAQFTIEFNGVEYVIEYDLYRNMYPQTVRHFIELADSGFYNDTVIHNYTSSDWYGGGYSYNAVNAENEATDYKSEYDTAAYFEENSKEKAYYDLFGSGALTATVFKPGATDLTFENALATLIGEFSANDHTVENGAPSSQFGALRMYYTAKTTTEKVHILTGQGQDLEHDYKYNSATSLFAIQVASSSSLTSSGYCLFGTLKSDSDNDKLQELQDAIDDYISDNYSSSSDFTSSVSSISIDNYEEVSLGDRGTDATYTVPAEPIIIRQVKITKY